MYGSLRVYKWAGESMHLILNSKLKDGLGDKEFTRTKYGGGEIGLVWRIGKVLGLQTKS